MFRTPAEPRQRYLTGSALMVALVCAVGLGFAGFVANRFERRDRSTEEIVFLLSYLLVPYIILLISLMPIRTIIENRRILWLIGSISILAQTPLLVFGTGLLFPMMAIAVWGAWLVSAPKNPKTKNNP